MGRGFDEMVTVQAVGLAGGGRGGTGRVVMLCWAPLELPSRMPAVWGLKVKKAIVGRHHKP